MPCMPEIVSKAAIFKKIDAVLNQDAATRGRIRTALLDSSQRLTDTAVLFSPDPAFDLTPNEQQHINLHWFGSWWPSVQALGPGGQGGVEQVVRLAFVHALDIAMEHDLPLDCYWECMYQHSHKEAHAQQEGPKPPPPPWYEPCGDESVQASVHWGQKRQITLTFHTPPPMGPMPLGGMTERDPIDVIRHDPANPGTVTTVPCWHAPSM